MPVQPTYPGVYIEEIPSGVRTITGVSTSIAAFIDYFKRGPMNKAVQIFNFGDFERMFGGLDALSEASYAIQQFFLNGGSQAYVVRVAGGNPVASNVTISNASPAGAEAIRIKAIDPGIWGDNVRVKIDHDTPVIGEFNMKVTEFSTSGTPVRQEVFLNLSMDNTRNNFVTKVVNDENTGSAIIRIDKTLGTVAPAANGTISGAHANINSVALSETTPTLQVLVNNVALQPVATLNITGGPHSLNKLAVTLENALRSVAPTNPLLAGATVRVVQNRLQVLAGSGSPGTLISFAAPVDDLTHDELLFNTGTVNVQEYTLGKPAVAATAQMNHQNSGTEEGDDGGIPDAAAIRGLQNDKTGIYALEDVDLFNILCIPITGTVTDGSFDAVYSEALTYCEAKRAFFVIDTPNGIDDLQEIKNWRSEKGSLIRSKNAALYYPRVLIPDPLNEFRLRSVGACGTIAGLYARTDSNRGVWKAPAGTEASLRNVSKLSDVLSDQENGVLNPLGVNCLRNFPVYGNVSWGARTLEGADALASEWKYVPVRRLALFLEESLFRGTQWVVFEPNDEPLWAQIRLNIGAFMNNLFKQGAFQGTSPRDAYLVKCDRETTTQNDINLGIVNILVGFAPLKPAEFVIIKIQQLAGQIQS